MSVSGRSYRANLLKYGSERELAYAFRTQLEDRLAEAEEDELSEEDILLAEDGLNRPLDPDDEDLIRGIGLGD